MKSTVFISLIALLLLAPSAIALEPQRGYVDNGIYRERAVGGPCKAVFVTNFYFHIPIHTGVTLVSPGAFSISRAQGGWATYRVQLWTAMANQVRSIVNKGNAELHGMKKEMLECGEEYVWRGNVEIVLGSAISNEWVFDSAKAIPSKGYENAEMLRSTVESCASQAFRSVKALGVYPPITPAQFCNQADQQQQQQDAELDKKLETPAEKAAREAREAEDLKRRVKESIEHDKKLQQEKAARDRAEQERIQREIESGSKSAGYRQTEDKPVGAPSGKPKVIKNTGVKGPDFSSLPPKPGPNASLSEKNEWQKKRRRIIDDFYQQ